MRRKVGVVALVLAVVGCGGSGSSGAASDTPPPQSPSATDSGTPGSFETLRDLELGVESAFVLCNNPMTVYDPPVIDGALAQADCKRDVALFLFDPSAVQAQAASLQDQIDGVLAIVVGTNWIVSCSSDVASCERVQATIGGELIVISP